MQAIYRTVLTAGVLAGLAGCDSPAKPKSPNSQAASTGRPETKAIIAVEAVGYDGQQVRKTVDNVLDINDQRNKELEALSEGK